MSRQVFLIAIVSTIVALAVLIPAGYADASPDRASAARGKDLYIKTGCYECHGTRGQGGGTAGPRLAPTPIPFEALLLQLRRPRARMPIYTDIVMPDRDVRDLYAYLQSIPKSRPATEIPMLRARSSP